jgi:uncharacterized protein YpuA (DUF1002 family)
MKVRFYKHGTRTINDVEYGKVILTTTPTDATQTDIIDITTTRDNTVIKCYITRNNSSTNMFTGVAVGSNYYLKFYFKKTGLNVNMR